MKAAIVLIGVLFVFSGSILLLLYGLSLGERLPQRESSLRMMLTRVIPPMCPFCRDPCLRRACYELLARRTSRGIRRTPVFLFRAQHAARGTQKSDLIPTPASPRIRCVQIGGLARPVVRMGPLEEEEDHHAERASCSRGGASGALELRALRGDHRLDQRLLHRRQPKRLLEVRLADLLAGIPGHLAVHDDAVLELVPELRSGDGIIGREEDLQGPQALEAAADAGGLVHVVPDPLEELDLGGGARLADLRAGDAIVVQLVLPDEPFRLGCNRRDGPDAAPELLLQGRVPDVGRRRHFRLAIHLFHDPAFWTRRGVRLRDVRVNDAREAPSLGDGIVLLRLGEHQHVRQGLEQVVEERGARVVGRPLDHDLLVQDLRGVPVRREKLPQPIRQPRDALHFVGVLELGWDLLSRHLRPLHLRGVHDGGSNDLGLLLRQVVGLDLLRRFIRFRRIRRNLRIACSGRVPKPRGNGACRRSRRLLGRRSSRQLRGRPRRRLRRRRRTSCCWPLNV
eukprot:scaffold2679_cov251-Pinguiococcus_pyrenoidosus.AAC.28